MGWTDSGLEDCCNVDMLINAGAASRMTCCARGGTKAAEKLAAAGGRTGRGGPRRGEITWGCVRVSHEPRSFPAGKESQLTRESTIRVSTFKSHDSTQHSNTSSWDFELWGLIS